MFSPQMTCSKCKAVLFKQWWNGAKGGYECRYCGTITGGSGGFLGQAEAPPILTRSYRANSQEQAAAQFENDARQMAAAGYFPISQSWAQGSWGCGAFLVALILAIVLIGILIFIYLLVVKPDGTLTVTYELRRPTQTEKAAPEGAAGNA